MMDSTRVYKQNQFNFSVNKWLSSHKKSREEKSNRKKSVTSGEFGIESINLMKQIVDSRKMKQKDFHSILN